ncbi:MAG: hypothetical protein LBE17_13280 [Treponema sp.]|jgi:hypothetical protein|nr:hypothetical protein [Treponema sp.]
MGGPIFSEYDTDDTEWKARTGHDIDGRTRGAGGLFLGADFGLLIGEVGALLSFERAKIYVGSDSYSARGMSLHIPLLLKMDFHLGPLVLQPLAGPYFNLALGKLDVEDYGDDPYANPPFGLVFGGLLGLNLGRGILFVDSRYEMDLGKTVAGNDPITIWKRSAYVLSFGYQIYLGRRR